MHAALFDCCMEFCNLTHPTFVVKCAVQVTDSRIKGRAQTSKKKEFCRLLALLFARVCWDFLTTCLLTLRADLNAFTQVRGRKTTFRFFFDPVPGSKKIQDFIFLHFELFDLLPELPKPANANKDRFFDYVELRAILRPEQSWKRQRWETHISSILGTIGISSFASDSKIQTSDVLLALAAFWGQTSVVQAARKPASSTALGGLSQRFQKPLNPFKECYDKDN